MMNSDQEKANKFLDDCLNNSNLEKVYLSVQKIYLAAGRFPSEREVKEIFKFHIKNI